MACLLVAAGCGEAEPPGGAIEAEGDVSAAERELLEALGYVYFAAEEAGGESGVVRFDRERASPGYNLYTIRHRCRVELIDMDGTPVHAWERPPCRFWSTAELLLPDGDLLVTGMDLTGDDRKEALDAMFAMRLDWSGRVVWKARVPAHHDLERTPDGRFLTLVGRYRSVPRIYPNARVKDEWLTFLSEQGEVIEEASILEILQRTPEKLRLRRVRPRATTDPPSVELFHANSVEWMPHPELVGRHPVYGADHILVCLRNQDTIAMIDWKQKRLVWAWGRGELELPHHPTLLPNGHVLVFDNGIRRGASRVLEVDPVADRIVWEYRGTEEDPFFSKNRGSNERLPNGNTLVADSDSGRAFEVTADGDIVWEYRVPDLNEEGQRATIERIKRYPVDAVDALLAAPHSSSASHM